MIMPEMFAKLFIITAMVIGVNGIIPEIGNVKSLLGADHGGSSTLSLPNLLELPRINDLQENWHLKPNIRLETGRLLLDGPQGGLWAKHSLESSDEWTIEFVFRSSGTENTDLKFADINGLAFWMIKDRKDILNAVKNFGGPEAFDGFQFLINNKETSGMKIFANDGTKKLGNSIAESVGQCVFNYLDSLVPFTIRISYSKVRNWFKVQVNNNLCFQTDQLSIPHENFKVGITGSLDKNSKETFEILKLAEWDYLTGDAIDDHGIYSEEGLIQIQYKTVTAEGSTPTMTPPGKVRESLMERNMRQRNELGKQTSLQSNQELIKLSKELVGKISDLELKLSSLQLQSASGSGSGAENTVLFETLSEMKNNQLKQQELIEKNQLLYTEKTSEILKAISSLNAKLVDEVREHQYATEEMSRKVDLLMTNHKEIAYQYKNSAISGEHKPSDIIPAIIRWLLVVIMVGIIVLIVTIYRLKKDIKHSKLL